MEFKVFVYKFLKKVRIGKIHQGLKNGKGKMELHLVFERTWEYYCRIRMLIPKGDSSDHPFLIGGISGSLE